MAGVCPSYSYKSLLKLLAVTFRKYSKYYQQREEVCLRLRVVFSPCIRASINCVVNIVIIASCYVTCSLSVHCSRHCMVQWVMNLALYEACKLRHTPQSVLSWPCTTIARAMHTLEHILHNYFLSSLPQPAIHCLQPALLGAWHLPGMLSLWLHHQQIQHSIKN